MPTGKPRQTDKLSQLNIETFIARLRQPGEITFEETMTVIDTAYRHTPTAFTNGIGDEMVSNSPDENQGSCKLFAFAQLHQLSQAETLACFGQHYRHVLDDSGGSSHANIRAFMKHGWKGVNFDGTPLEPIS